MDSEEERQSIPHISPSILGQGGIFEGNIYPNMDVSYYWSDCWTPEFYRSLAKRGFISVAMDHESLGSLLLPEMQKSYALLDWHNLHVSGHVRKILNRGSLEAQGFSLRLSGDPRKVIGAVRNQFGSDNWINDEYEKLLIRLASPEERGDNFALKTTELYEKGELVAGELGYTIGRTYTSLTGFSSRKREHRNRGTLQLVLLARLLEKRGYAFWNLGHPYMEYKISLGARILPREEFLYRWLREINQAV